MARDTRTAVEKGSAPLSARVTDPKTLSAIDFIDAKASRSFNMSEVLRLAVEAAAAELGWVYCPPIPFGDDSSGSISTADDEI